MENPLDDIDAVLAMTDPAERAVEIGKVLNRLRETNATLAAARQEDVRKLRDQGLSLAEIGVKLDLHRNRVQQILEGR